eukprot:1638862-Pleurochrysis_carterae.AAC.1
MAKIPNIRKAGACAAATEPARTTVQVACMMSRPRRSGTRRTGQSALVTSTTQRRSFPRSCSHQFSPPTTPAAVCGKMPRA